MGENGKRVTKTIESDGVTETETVEEQIGDGDVQKTMQTRQLDTAAQQSHLLPPSPSMSLFPPAPGISPPAPAPYTYAQAYSPVYALPPTPAPYVYPTAYSPAYVPPQPFAYGQYGSQQFPGYAQ